MSEERKHKYWICDTCALAKNWYLPHPMGVTAIHGLCGHCDSEKKQMLIPTCDYASKDGKKKYAGD